MASDGAWRASRPWTGWVMFGGIFFIFFGLSFLYSWGIISLMDKYVDPSSTRNTFSFGDELVIMVGLILWMTAYSDVMREAEKLRTILEMIAEHSSLLDIFIQCIPLIVDPKTIIKVTSWQGSVANYTAGEAILETFLMIVMSPMLFLWESTTRRDYGGEGAELLGNFGDPALNPAGRKNVVQDYVTKTREMNKAQSMGITMLSAIQNRMYLFDAIHSSNTITTRVQPTLTNLRTKCEHFEKLRDSSPWWVITFFTFILGVLYLFAAPFLLWFGQGWFTFATYAMVFLFIGGQLSYRWFISDIFYRPTDMHIQRVYDEIAALALKADKHMQHSTDFRRQPHYTHLVAVYNISKPPSGPALMKYI